jgi:putative ABC transport system permease protein
VVQPLRDAMVSNARLSLLLMWGAVSFVLLIACANMANLLLSRATGRKREFAIRSALGASPGRILRQLLTESIVLSSAGGLTGLVVGIVGVRALLKLSPSDLPRVGVNGTAIGLDWRLLVFTLVVSLFTGILFGLFPALSASRPDLNSTLKETGNRSIGSRQSRARSLFVIGEISLAVVLLIGAALLIRTFLALRQVSPGFESHNVLIMDMSLAGARFAKTASVAGLVSDACQRLKAIPGVEAVSATSYPPMEGRFGLPFLIIGRSSEGDGIWMNASPGYFDVFKIPILRGRAFTEHDNSTAPRVVLINESMAKKFWPNQNPLGQQIVIGRGLGPKFEDVPREIIGVVGDSRDIDVSHVPYPTMIIPQAQTPDGITALGMQFGPIFWLVRTRMEPHAVANAVARQLREASGGLPVGHIRTMDERMLRSISRQNFNMLLLTIFATAALVLAAVGIYGVMAYSIAQRTQEIGIRLALGAGRASIRNLVLRQGLLLAGVGVLVGVGAAFGLMRLITSFLFGVTAWDPVVFSTVPLLLASVALAAAWLPAWRATRLDPLQSLHVE